MEFLRRLYYLLNRRKLESALENDMAFHREMMARDHQKDFGNTLLLRECSRAVWGWTWLDRLFQDLRFGARLLTKSPALACTAITVLALGIGVNVTAFNIVDVMFFKPLAVRDPLSLVRLTCNSPTSASTEVPYPAVAFYRDHKTAFSAVLAQTSTHMTLTGNTTEDVQVGLVSGNYFGDLGAGAAYGRLLLPTDENPDAPAVAVLGYGFWQRRFGGDPTVVGSTVRLNQHPATVVGVTAYDFSGLDPEHGQEDSAWVVIAQTPYFVPETKMLSSFDISESGVHMTGRLRPGVSRKMAESALAPLAQELVRQHPGEVPRGERLLGERGGYAANLGPEDGRVFPIFGTFAALVLLILAAACGNLGNVLLGRAAAREREISIRMALGATRSRIMRQLMTESLLLALLGSAAGLFLSWIVSRPMVIWLGGAGVLDLKPDWRVSLFAFALGTLACVLFGLPPARHAARQAHHMSRTRTIFMSTQVAASCVLLIVSGLLVRGLHKIFNTDLGFDYKQVVVIDPQLYAHAYAPAKARAYMKDLRDRVVHAPGILSSTLVSVAPMGNHIWRGPFTSDSGVRVIVYFNSITPQYFKTMAIPLLRGRDFKENESDTVIVSQSYASQMWPGKDPLQQTFTWQKKQLPVVGVAGSARTLALGDVNAVEVYFPAQEKDFVSAAMLVRTSQPAEATAGILAGIAKPLDPVLSPEAHALKASFENKISDTRKMAGVVSGMGGLALLLALVGLYGIVSYTVTQRTREIGIRLALGASSSRIMETIISRFVLPVSLALVAGSGLAALLSTVLRGELYGLSNLDPLTYVTATVLLAATAGLATLPPARRALRVDPAAALRCE
jgi:predicted permease